MNKDNRPLLYGSDETRNVVAVEYDATSDQTCRILRYLRRKDATLVEPLDFRPFLWIESARLDPPDEPHETLPLEGDAPLDTLMTFASWPALQRAAGQLKKQSGKSPSAPDAPYLLLNDPVQQYLASSGCTLFKGMEFSELRRMQLDIETYTQEGFDFCHPERETDRITAVALSDNQGWSQVIDGSKQNEKELIEEMIRLIRERDPDVIEGHNIFDFDLDYIRRRARRHGIRLALGRDGSSPAFRASRFNVAERTNHYTRANIHGRHIVDTLHLVRLYDITDRSLERFGLKHVARHFGLSKPDRTYLEGSQLWRIFDENPALLMQYALDDATETAALAALLAPVYFAQTQMLPMTYQNAIVRGNATKIDALLLREYLRLHHALPYPEAPQRFAGGYTDLFVKGLALNVHHCDLRSLYPSLILTGPTGPARDALGAFRQLLDELRTQRLDWKNKARHATEPASQLFCEARQRCMKILINSFYGYLGFAQGRFNDYAAAGHVAAQGRQLLQHMIETVKQNGGTPIEIDTDGIYYVPPAAHVRTRDAFRQALADALPPGIHVEFDGEYPAMFSYKMKNYALLEENGHMIIKGAALKSRGIERFQRDYIRTYLRLKLEQRDTEIPGLQQDFRQAIANREWDISLLAKTETLKTDPETYATKRNARNCARQAAYEVALASRRPYRAGDQISYYITGTRKQVAAHAAARLVADWNPDNRDENIPYYLAKLDALFRKFPA